MAKYPMYIVNQSIPLVLQMSPNPNSISIDRERVFTKTQTLAGFVFEHWGEQPKMLRVKGKTLPFLGTDAPGPNQEIAVEYSLFALQQLFQLDKRMLVGYMAILKNAAQKLNLVSGNSTLAQLRSLSSTFIYYKFDLYNGFFTKFNWQQNAETTPRHYEYEFEFLITSSAQSALVDTLFTSASPVGTIAGLAQLPANGNMGQAAAVLAGGSIATGAIAGATALNI